MLAICRNQDPQCNANTTGEPLRYRGMQEGRDYVEVPLVAPGDWVTNGADNLTLPRILAGQGDRCIRCGQRLDALDAILVRSVH